MKVKWNLHWPPCHPTCLYPCPWRVELRNSALEDRVSSRVALGSKSIIDQDWNRHRNYGISIGGLWFVFLYFIWSHLMQFHKTHGNQRATPISTMRKTMSCQLRLLSGTLKTGEQVYFKFSRWQWEHSPRRQSIPQNKKQKKKTKEIIPLFPYCNFFFFFELWSDL